MEPKVIQRCLSQTFKAGTDPYIKWRFDPKFAFYKQGGSGNNWALGYQYYGQDEYEHTTNLVRKSLENMDYFGGFHVIQSLAGGTGSGLGAHLVECLRDDFPKSNMINLGVWPY